jgi:hypothetical protein
VATDDCAGRAEQAGAAELQQLRHQAIARRGNLRYSLGDCRSRTDAVYTWANNRIGAFFAADPKLMHRAAYAKRRVRGLIHGSEQGLMERQIPVENATMLLVDRSPTAMKIAARIGSCCLISVSPGAGLTRSLSVPQPGEAPLRAPLPGLWVRSSVCAGAGMALRGGKSSWRRGILVVPARFRDPPFGVVRNVEQPRSAASRRAAFKRCWTNIRNCKKQRLC